MFGVGGISVGGADDHINLAFLQSVYEFCDEASTQRYRDTRIACSEATECAHQVKLSC